ncbi:MAG: amidohydrolase family protein [Pseudomonadales bacterium]|jgi:imidazolonepropionase-like amidohydrolase|nr:amidohydrolase family protein [Pseudomonadales bacterium]MDP6469982.1 amidohydrolase family protein [Pseudomonadales bacterium]MDP6829150.1 amidohydrolase family protein [Pseudomonadales bacterium]
MSALIDAAGGAAAVRAYVDMRRNLLRSLHAAGVGILLGSDSPQIFNVPGFSIHRALQSMVEAGLTPYEALVTGTVNPARFFDQEQAFGSLQPGTEADTVLLNSNPLDDISNTRDIRGVMVTGRWLDEAARGKLLRGIGRSCPACQTASAAR